MTTHSNIAHIYAPANEQANIQRQRLKEIIHAKSFITGETITLTSGKISNHYFNTKPTMMDAEGSSLIASLMLDSIQNLNATLIGGLEMGAVPLAASIASISFVQNRPINAFFIRKNPKGHGTNSLIEGLGRSESVANQKVVVVEDVTTTGGSAIKAAEILRAEGASVVLVITIVDREEGAYQAFAEAGLNFTALFGGSEFTS